ncbi:hypothetical protein N6L24_11885 [Cognatishimia sp. SS12]|uniref:hypothetical protein n=1 Tax=Cognatishimia sp. SS12 TaxID=2979465 RepID=UPI00232D0B2B|nr:hypothetical protein [Cognatishimia sp. SS12]MDC0738979.1 hypothetical protein [Cognatishimia sp. SS12]
MYTRVTPYRMKPGSRAEATKKLEALKERIMALPGQQQFLNMMNDDTGEGYIVSTTNLEEPTDDTMEKVNALWGEFKDFLTAEPQAQKFDLIADWKK